MTEDENKFKIFYDGYMTALSHIETALTLSLDTLRSRAEDIHKSPSSSSEETGAETPEELSWRLRVEGSDRLAEKTRRALVAILDFYLAHSRKIWPSPREIADLAGVGKGSISGFLDRGEKTGFIKVIRRPRQRGEIYHRPVYRLTFPDITNMSKKFKTVANTGQ